MNWLDYRRTTHLTFLRPAGVLSYQSIKHIRAVSPMVERTVHDTGLTYGLGPSSYDLRVRQDVVIGPGEFRLFSTLESISLPWDVCATVQD